MNGPSSARFQKCAEKNVPCFAMLVLLCTCRLKAVTGWQESQKETLILKMCERTHHWSVCSVKKIIQRHKPRRQSFKFCMFSYISQGTRLQFFIHLDSILESCFLLHLTGGRSFWDLFGSVGYTKGQESSKHWAQQTADAVPISSRAFVAIPVLKKQFLNPSLLSGQLLFCNAVNRWKEK